MLSTRVDDRHPSRSQQIACVLYAKDVLCARVVRIEAFGVDVDRLRKRIDAIKGEQYIAQTDESARANLLMPGLPRHQRAMHRNRLRAVFGQMNGMQAMLAT